MNWIEHDLTGYTDVKVYSNTDILNNQNRFFKMAKSMFKIVKQTNNEVVLTINGIEYTFPGNNGSEFYIEVTSIVGSTSYYGTFTIQHENDTVLSLDYISIDGMRRTNIVSEKLPSLIPVIQNSDLPFYLQLVNEAEWLQTGGDWYVVGANDVVTSIDAQPAISGGSFTYILRTTGETFDETFDFTFQVSDEEIRYFQMEEVECEFNHILVEWVSKYGQLKSWWFEVEKTIFESPRQLDMDVLDDGFKTFKNKQVSLQLKTPRCDIYNQLYLSDLAISDEVYVYDGDTVETKRQCKVEQNNLEVEKKRKDVIIKINSYKYDII